MLSILLELVLYSLKLVLIRYKIHTGRWLVEGNPQIILFDIGSASFKMDEFKHELFEKAGIGIPHEDVECNDVCILGLVVSLGQTPVVLQYQ